MTIFACRVCGATFHVRPEEPHETPELMECIGPVEPYVPAALASPSATSILEAEAREARAIHAAERSASQAQVALYDCHVALRGAARSSQRAQHAEERARRAESALALAQAVPASMVRLLLQVESLLMSFSGRGICASCGLRYGHRPRCRIVSMLARIDLLVSRRPARRARPRPVGLRRRESS